MLSKSIKQHCLMMLSLVAALLLQLLPLPALAIWFYPNWILIVLIFWLIAMPQLYGIVLAWTVGLLVDLLLGGPLGEHAFIFTAIAYIIQKMQIKLLAQPWWQQFSVIFLLVLCAMLLHYVLMAMIKQAPNTGYYWVSALTSALIWPWVSVLLTTQQQDD